MGFRRDFSSVLAGRCPNPAELLADIESRYAGIAPDVAFARSSPNPVDRRLDFCAYFLATIQALEARGQTFAEIRATCVAIAHRHVLPRNALHRWLRRLPVMLLRTPLRRLAARLMQARAGRKGHPDGFLVNIITDPARTNGLGWGLDILECGIVNLYRKHDAARYVPILCEVDELTTSLAGLRMFRTGTIALGAARCDFRYRIR